MPSKAECSPGRPLATRQSQRRPDVFRHAIGDGAMNAPLPFRPPLGAVEVDANVVHRWMAADEAILVDVRETSEYEMEHIPGAVLCPMSVFDPTRFPRIAEKRLVLHCAVGKRSAAAAQRLIAAGYPTVYNLRAGIRGWRDAGFATGTTPPIDGSPALPLISLANGTLPAQTAADSSPRAPSAPSLPSGIHPGRVLRDEFLKPLRLRIGELSQVTGIPVRRVGQMVRGERRIDAESALRLARYFCTADDFWLRLQSDHDLAEARRVAGAQIARDVTPRTSSTTA